MKILIVGPSDIKSKGGMATVISGIRSSNVLTQDITIFPSFIDGNKPVRLLYSIYAYLRFCAVYRKYDLFHIHVASKGSTFRKMHYLKKIKRAGKKCILHIHGAKYIEFYNSLSEERKVQVRAFFNSADTVIALSDEWKKTFEDMFGLTNCVSLPNGIDTDEFREAVSDPELTGNTFVMLGRLGERKGSYDLIKAMEKVIRKKPDVKLIMAGDGEVEKVSQLVRKKGLEKNIELPGWIGKKEKKEILKKASVLILPSYNEGLPMAILEGMASGKAVISTTVGAIPEVIKEENGILVTPGDVDGIAQAILKLAGNTDTLMEMGNNNIEKIDNEFSMKIMHKRLSNIYEAYKTEP